MSLASNKIPGSKEDLAETGDRSIEQMIHESFRETMADIESRMEARVRGKGDQVS